MRTRQSMSASGGGDAAGKGIEPFRCGLRARQQRQDERCRRSVRIALRPAVSESERTCGGGSPPGGLWLSVLCRPPDEAAAEVMSLRAALAVAPVLEQAVPGVRLSIKWPNDLLIDGRKTGGILCEARWQGTVLGWIAVGLGLNVSNPLPEDLGEHH